MTKQRTLIQDLDRALAAPSDSLVRQVLAPWIPKTAPELVDLGQAARDPQPEQLIGYGQGSLLAAGEVLVLAGAGGAGKSTLACQLALEAATAPAEGQGYTAGLTVALGQCGYTQLRRSAVEGVASGAAHR